MIISFYDQATEDFFHGRTTNKVQKFPNEIHNPARRKLDMLNAAHDLRDLNTPGNRLEKKKGILKGYYAIWINKQWRLIFVWEKGNAMSVSITDYH